MTDIFDPRVMGAVVKPLGWVIDKEPECPYNNAVADTPFGRYLITWKGWKEAGNQGFTIDEAPGRLPGKWGGDLKETQAVCEADFAEKHARSALIPAPVPQEATAEPVADWPLWCSKAANDVLTVFGYAHNISLEPGDARRDRIAKVIAAASPPSHDAELLAARDAMQKLANRIVALEADLARLRAENEALQKNADRIEEQDLLISDMRSLVEILRTNAATAEAKAARLEAALRWVRDDYRSVLPAPYRVKIDAALEAKP